MRKGRLAPKMSKAMRSSSLDDIKRYVKPLDQYQTGRLVKRYTDPSEFLKASRAAEDSAFVAHMQQKIFNDSIQSGNYEIHDAYDAVADPKPIVDYNEAYDKALSAADAQTRYGNLSGGNTLGYSNYRGIDPVGYYQAVNSSTTGPFTRMYPVYKPPVVTPILSESMESIPVKSPTRLQVKPLQEVTPVTRDVGTATQPFIQPQKYTASKYLQTQGKPTGYINKGDNTGRIDVYQKGGQVVTDYDKDWDYKKEEGTVYTRKKGSDNWIAPKKGSVAERAIQRKIFGSPTKEEEAVQMKIPQTPVLDIRMPEVTGDTVPSPRRVPIAPRKVDPEVTIGDFLPDLPDVSLPKVQMPEVSRPKISLPDMPDMPKVSMPDISLPDVEAPKVSMPDMPDMDIPNLELYENLERDAGRIKGIVKDLGEYGEEFTDYAKDVISDAVSSGKSNLNALKNFFKGELKDYAEDFVGRAKDIEDSVDNAIDKVKSLPELLKNISDVEEEIVEKGPAPSPVVPKPIAEVEDKETFEEMLVRAANNLNTGHILAGDQMYRVEDGKLTKRMETIVGRTTSARKGAPSELSYAATLEKNWYNADGSLREFETLEGLKTGPEIEEEGLAEKYSGTTPAGIYEFTNQPVKAYEKLGYSSYLKGVGETPDPTTRTYFTNEKGERQYVHSSTAYHPYPGEKAKAIRDKALKDLNISNELSGSCLQNMDCDNRDMGILLNSNPSFRDSLIILNPNMGALSAEAVRQLAVEFDLAQSKKEQEDILKLLAGNK
jgi:hypothetical protein